MYFQVTENFTFDGLFGLEWRKQLTEVQVPRVFRSVIGKGRLKKQEENGAGRLEERLFYIYADTNESSSPHPKAASSTGRAGL